MILLQASHVTKQYDGHEVLIDASVVVGSSDKVALVGANGAGKSTLLRLLIGQEAPDDGVVSLAKETSIGYVAQFVDVKPGLTVFNYVAESFAHVYAMEAALQSMEQDMARPEIYQDKHRFEELSLSYDRRQQEFMDVDGYAVESRIRRVLDGLQFPVSMHDRPVSALSGGQKTRLSLARLLAQEPDILVLDEPTNYLDTETLTWLEGYLQGYNGAVLLVSHDRYFLDQVATLIYELENGRTTRYVGNYSRYIDEKAARFELDVKRYEIQQREIAKMETFIQKNIVRATTTKRAQSRRKLLEKMDRIEKPTQSKAKVALHFAPSRASGKDVLRIRNLVIGFPAKSLAGPLDLLVTRGQRIAIVGPNGIGKTTFLKHIVGKAQPPQGEIVWGTGVDIGYYDQEQEALNPSKPVLNELWDDYPSLDATAIRTALGRFLFRGEDVDKPVSALSGGERSRLSLCHLMLEQTNVLIMDEPTNHLDLLSKEVLEDALQDYSGTLIFVSHDRYFIDALATHVLVLNATGFTTYIGNYTDYMEKKRDTEKWADPKDPPTAATKDDGAESPPSNPAQPEVSKRVHVRSADIRKLQQQVAALEMDIANVEEQIADIAESLTQTIMSQEVDKSLQLQVELAELEQNHDALIEKWETAAAELERLEALQRAADGNTN